MVFRHPDEKTLYIAGDTIWRDAVAADLQKHQPDIVVLNAGYAHVIGFGPIIMGKKICLTCISAAAGENRGDPYGSYQPLPADPPRAARVC